ncbi:MAG TPA: hypothetical protein VMB35_03965 [Methanomicrobiales archaeon]|nr:hypothetical protein [Methanomicrobiales archaeon]
MLRSVGILMGVLILATVLVSGCSNVSLGKTQVGDFGSATESQRIQECFIDKYGDPGTYAGPPRFLETMVSDGIVNDMPTDKVTRFSKDTPSIYIWTFYEGFRAGDQITALWTFNGQQYASLSRQVQGNYGLVSGQFDRPSSGWVTGTHTIMIAGSGADDSASFEIVDGATQSVALPCQATPPITTTTPHVWTVAATARQSGTDIIVTWQGGQDNAYVVGYGVTLNDMSGGSCPIHWDCIWVNTGNTVGNSTRFGNKGDSTNNHVVVNASFTDGSGQVVLDTYV